MNTMVSERRGSNLINPKSPEIDHFFFLRDSRCARRPWDFFFIRYEAVSFFSESVLGRGLKPPKLRNHRKSNGWCASIVARVEHEANDKAGNGI